METKKEIEERIRTRLSETEEQIEALMAQATQSDYDEYLTDLRMKQDLAKARLAELGREEGEAWQDLEAELGRAVRQIQDALQIAAPDSE